MHGVQLYSVFRFSDYCESDEDTQRRIGARRINWVINETYTRTWSCTGSFNYRILSKLWAFINIKYFPHSWSSYSNENAVQWVSCFQEGKDYRPKHSSSTINGQSTEAVSRKRKITINSAKRSSNIVCNAILSCHQYYQLDFILHVSHPTTNTQTSRPFSCQELYVKAHRNCILIDGKKWRARNGSVTILVKTTSAVSLM